MVYGVYGVYVDLGEDKTVTAVNFASQKIEFK